MNRARMLIAGRLVVVVAGSAVWLGKRKAPAATILARQGRIAEAREAAQRALKVQPGYAPSLEFLQSLR